MPSSSTLPDILPLASSTFTFFFFNDTATTEIYTLSLHDALPISALGARVRACGTVGRPGWPEDGTGNLRDRKSTRLNSSHSQISYAVFCLKKKTDLVSVIHSPPRRRVVTRVLGLT